MKKIILLTLVFVLCMSVSQSWARDERHSWERDDKLLAKIVSVLADKGLSPEEKTDKIMGLAPAWKIVAMLNLFDKRSPKTDDKCMDCVRGCNRGYCDCVGRCNVPDNGCYSDCVWEFISCLAGCDCNWGYMAY